MSNIAKITNYEEYDRAFFEQIADESLPSARIVVPMIMDLARPKSVIDLGCGPGAWLRAFKENGVEVVCGIDGEYVDQSTLLIDKTEFVAADLTKPINISRDYDLAICIEVAEHLPDSATNHLIAQLAKAAPLVLFSAAIPGQGGINHVNEQWPSYWHKRFSEQGCVRLDLFRPRIRDDLRICSFIRQNLFLFASKEWVASNPTTRAFIHDAERFDVNWVHASLYEHWFWMAHGGLGSKELLARLPAALRRSMVRWLRKWKISSVECAQEPATNQ